jgi:hypothetical protein
MTRWTEHEATPCQQKLSPKHGTGIRITQVDLLISMLRQARTEGRALELPEIMRAGIAQHDARLKEIRSRGFEVVNEITRADSVVQSRYFLRFDPEQDAPR